MKKSSISTWILSFIVTVIIGMHITPFLISPDKIFAWQDAHTHTVITVVSRCGIPYGIRWPYIKSNFNPFTAIWKNNLIYEFPEILRIGSVLQIKHGDKMWELSCIKITTDSIFWNIRDLDTNDLHESMVELKKPLNLGNARVWFILNKDLTAQIIADDYIIDPDRDAYQVAFISTSQKVDGGDIKMLFKRYPWD